jgi:hypothetical protein
VARALKVAAAGAGAGDGASVTEATPITIPQDELTALTFTTEVFDHGGLFEPATPDRLTIKKPGVYVLKATVNLAWSGAGYIFIELDATNPAVMLTAANINPTAEDNIVFTLTAIAELAADQYITVSITQDTGGNVTANPEEGVISNLAAQQITGAL